LKLRKIINKGQILIGIHVNLFNRIVGINNNNSNKEQRNNSSSSYESNIINNYPLKWCCPGCEKEKERSSIVFSKELIIQNFNLKLCCDEFNAVFIRL
jgi:hypothetical protein